MKVNGYEIKAGAYLCGANLSGANLSGANLSDAYLCGAYLRSANLPGANLPGANLSDANLYGAYLRSANLRYANLSGANLCGANLRSANLSGANLSGANLSGANLSGANLCGADLCGANLTEVDVSSFLITPQKGRFTAFKKLSDGVVIEIEIPAPAKRVNAIGSRKCRADKIKVVKVVKGVMTNPLPSTHYPSILYEVGKTYKADKWDGDIRVECTHGIHFFMTLEEARNWE